jgi:hypothetical protein
MQYKLNFTVLTNSKYYKLINKIKDTVTKNGIDESLIDDFKQLRKMVVTENQPLLAKVIRLTYQQIETNGTFNVGIPDDEPIEGFENETTDEAINPVESLNYLLANMSDLSNKMNLLEIRAYVNSMKELAGEDY